MQKCIDSTYDTILFLFSDYMNWHTIYTLLKIVVVVVVVFIRNHFTIIIKYP